MTAITIKANIIEDAVQWLTENRGDMMVDNVSAIYRRKPTAEDGTMYLFDEEEGKSMTITVDRQVWALQKLADLIDGEKLFVGGIKNARDLEDLCNWDVEVCDAFFQLCYHGEVIYG